MHANQTLNRFEWKIPNLTHHVPEDRVEFASLYTVEGTHLIQLDIFHSTAS